MITVIEESFLMARVKTAARNLVGKWGDGAEEAVYRATNVSPKAKEALLQAIKDHRNYKENGFKVA